MTLETPINFDPAEFLASTGLGRRLVQLKPGHTFFRQGDACDSIFYLQKGRAKLTVISTTGKDATITLLDAGDFIGEESVAGSPGARMATASAITNCIALKIERAEQCESCGTAIHYALVQPEALVNTGPDAAGGEVAQERISLSAVLVHQE